MNPPDQDHEDLMDHLALEAINAVHAKDHQAFRSAHHMLVADIIGKLSDEMEAKEPEDKNAL